jgi:AraC-like DNA-binding protein
MHAEHAIVRRVALPGSRATVELLRAAYVGHRFAPHAHEEYVIAVVEAGAARTRLGRGAVVVPAGAVLALDPGAVHTGEPAHPDGYRYRALYVGEELVRRSAGPAAAADVSPPAPAPTFPRAPIHDPALAARLTRAHALLEGGADPLAAEEALVDALAMLVRRHGTRARRAGAPGAAGRGGAMARRVREFLEEEHARVVTLAELSALTGLSPCSVSRAFRAAVGVPPYTYLALVRVRRARELIARGLPLSVVTHATGFADQSHFTRRFKQVMGVTPGQYARAVAGASGADGTGRGGAAGAPYLVLHGSPREGTARTGLPPLAARCLRAPLARAEIPRSAHGAERGGPSRPAPAACTA